MEQHPHRGDEARADLLIQRREERRKRDATSDDQPQRTGWAVLLVPHMRPALVVGLTTLAALQQFGGINTIIYYAPTIIQSTGLTASNSIFYSVAIGTINLVMTLVAIRLIDRAGRRQLLVSLFGMLIMMALLGLSFVAGWSSVVSVVVMVLYIAAFAAGLGPVFWVLVGEIFPPNARARQGPARRRP